MVPHDFLDRAPIILLNEVEVDTMPTHTCTVRVTSAYVRNVQAKGGARERKLRCRMPAGMVSVGTGMSDSQEAILVGNGGGAATCPEAMRLSIAHTSQMSAKGPSESVSNGLLTRVPSG